MGALNLIISFANSYLVTSIITIQVELDATWCLMAHEPHHEL